MIAEVNDDGLVLNGNQYVHEVPLASIEESLGMAARTIIAGPPEPYGHRNNRAHLFDALGIYLTEHHARQLVGSVNFILDTSDGWPHPLEHPFRGELIVHGIPITAETTESDLISLGRSMLRRDLPGEYSARRGPCWVGFWLKGRRKKPGAKRGSKKFVTMVSVSLKE